MRPIWNCRMRVLRTFIPIVTRRLKKRSGRRAAIAARCFAKFWKPSNKRYPVRRSIAKSPDAKKQFIAFTKKMRDKQRSFSQVLDVYGVRIVVKAPLECYLCMGALHALYKPVPGKIKDYIAVPKINGYQSLHTTLVGPFGM